MNFKQPYILLKCLSKRTLAFIAYKRTLARVSENLPGTNYAFCEIMIAMHRTIFLLLFSFVLCCCDQKEEMILPSNKSTWEFTEGIVGSPFCGLYVSDESPVGPPETLTAEIFGINDEKYKRTKLIICGDNFEIEKDEIIAVGGSISITQNEIVMSTKNESLALKIVYQSPDTLILKTDAIYSWGANVTFIFKKISTAHP